MIIIMVIASVCYCYVIIVSFIVIDVINIAITRMILLTSYFLMSIASTTIIMTMTISIVNNTIVIAFTFIVILSVVTAILTVAITIGIDSITVSDVICDCSYD